MQRDSKVPVGSLVRARDNGRTGAYEGGEAGVCFDVGWPSGNCSFIFERGGYVTGFDQKDVNNNLEVSGLMSHEVAGYKFKDFKQVQADYRVGRFTPAFEEQNIEAAHERSAVPHLRDILREEYDENLKREAAGIEPKGIDLDMDR